jgi:hypothetical protein
MNIRLVGGVLAALVVAPAGAAIDWSQPVICAAQHTANCSLGSDCRSAEAGGELPVFLRIDLAERRIIPLGSGGMGTKPHPIQVLEQAGRRLILQGVENGRGWTAVVDRVSGQMVTSASDGSSGFLVFSACTGMVAPKPD